MKETDKENRVLAPRSITLEEIFVFSAILAGTVGLTPIIVWIGATLLGVMGAHVLMTLRHRKNLLPLGFKRWVRIAHDAPVEGLRGFIKGILDPLREMLNSPDGST